MKFNIHGKKIEMTEPIKKYIETKIGRLDKYFENPENITATVVGKLVGRQQAIEVTINANSLIIRGEEANSDLYASIDIVSDKIERQIRKNKTRISKKKSKDKINIFLLDFENDIEEKEKTIVKHKVIDTKPMDEEEAILQMELIDHDFFVFKNSKTDDINVIYKRSDGNYGLIETKKA